MATNFVSLSEFSRIAGVAPGTVTHAKAAILKDAIDQNRIDVNHPAAQNYLASHPVDTTRDPLHDKVEAYCKRTGVYTLLSILRKFDIGRHRAEGILHALKRDAAKRGKKLTKPKKRSAEPAPVVPKVRRGRGRPPKPKPEPAPESAPVPAVLEDVAARGVAFTLNPLPGRPANSDLEDIRELGNHTLQQIVARYGTETGFLDWLSATQKIELIHEKRLKNAKSEGELISRKLVKVGVLEPIETAHVKMLTMGAKTIAVRAKAMFAAGRTSEEVENLVVDQLSSFIRPVKTRAEQALSDA